MERDLKPMEWRPFTGLLDDRSEPDLMPAFSFRQLQNVQVKDQGKLERRAQWQKLFSIATYNNDDLHDQLLELQTFQVELPSGDCDVTIQTRDTGRQPVTLLFQAQSSTGHRKLLAGTDSRVYVLNQSTGNWKIITDGLGRGTDDGTAPEHRFKAAQSLDMVILTNNYDKPFGWMFDQATVGCEGRATTEITDLDLIGLTKAKCVWAWKDVVFFADVEMDGIRYPHRIVWGDYQKPTSYDPSLVETIAGYRDLDYGEIILGGMEIGNLFLIYTDRRIWQMEAVGGEQTFSITRRYTPSSKDSREGCLFYPNTLVSLGDSHVYLGIDGIYEYDLYATAPKRPDWVHRATNQIFSNIDEDYCNEHIAHYDELTKEIWITWVEAASVTGLPSQTLVINKQYQHVSTIDHGFTAFVQYQSDDLDTMRDFIIQNCICTPAELAANGYGFTKEGLPLTDEVPVDCAALTSIYSTTIKTEFERPLIGDPNVVGTEAYNWYTLGIYPPGLDYAEVEDWEALSTSVGSLCEKLDGQVLEDNCVQCQTPQRTVMACAVDWCLKERAEVYYRERCTNPTAIGATGAEGYVSAVGTYEQDGFDTIIIGAPQNLPSQGLINSSEDLMLISMRFCN